MQESKLFTKAELEALEKRKRGIKLDPTGIFSRMVKPKIFELFEWFKMRKELQKLVRDSKNKNTK